MKTPGYIFSKVDGCIQRLESEKEAREVKEARASEPYDGAAIREAAEAHIRKCLDAMPESKRLEYLVGALANERARREERLREVEAGAYGADDAKRSAAYRARIVELEAQSEGV